MKINVIKDQFDSFHVPSDKGLFTFYRQTAKHQDRISTKRYKTQVVETLSEVQEIIQSQTIKINMSGVFNSPLRQKLKKPFLNQQRKTNPTPKIKAPDRHIIFSAKKVNIIADGYNNCQRYQLVSKIQQQQAQLQKQRILQKQILISRPYLKHKNREKSLTLTQKNMKNIKDYLIKRIVIHKPQSFLQQIKLFKKTKSKNKEQTQYLRKSDLNIQTNHINTKKTKQKLQISDFHGQKAFSPSNYNQTHKFKRRALSLLNNYHPYNQDQSIGKVEYKLKNNHKADKQIQMHRFDDLLKFQKIQNLIDFQRNPLIKRSQSILRTSTQRSQNQEKQRKVFESKQKYENKSKQKIGKQKKMTQDQQLNQKLKQFGIKQKLISESDKKDIKNSN